MRTPCTFDGCEQPKRGPSGLCNSHRAQARRGRPLTPIKTAPPVTHDGTPDGRFWAKVNKTETCWLWTANTNASTATNGGGGYGQFSLNGKIVKAHRYSYTTLIGPVPEGLELDHLCRVRACVRPDHLEPVTKSVNLKRGRNKRREQTECIHGHPFTPDNTYVSKLGRACRTCARENDRRRRSERLRESA